MTVQADSRTPTLSELLRLSAEYHQQDLHTALPGKIVSYDASTQKAKVKPLIKRLVTDENGDEKLEPLPEISQVPIVFQRGGGGFYMTFPIEVDDLVLLIFNERSIDKYTAGDASDVDLDEFRMHDLSDAVAIPGFYPDSKALVDIDSDDLVLGLDGGVSIHINKDGLINLGSKDAADFVALAQKVLDELDRVKTDLDTVKTFMDALLTVMNVPVNEPGNGSPSAYQAAIGLVLAPILPYPTPTTPASVAAEKVKAD